MSPLMFCILMVVVSGVLGYFQTKRSNERIRGMWLDLAREIHDDRNAWRAEQGYPSIEEMPDISWR